MSPSQPSSPSSSLTIPLWPGRDAPAMRVTFPPRPADDAGDTAGSPPRPALIVFRGGAYATASGSGRGAAEWAASHGLVGVEVEYRNAGTGDAYPAPYADAARAVRLVRSHAAAWHLDPAQVTVIGFSAGGHLASLLSTQPQLYRDPLDELAPTLSARPDLVVLAYPVISFLEGYRPGAYVGSAANFLGQPAPDEDTRRRFSSELHVTADHPPVFVWTTEDDALVPVSVKIVAA
jgi:acetyl esterase/lipase